MIKIEYIEEKCKQLKDVKIPALQQLKKAYYKNDLETYNRIAENVIDFLKENDIKISQFPKRIDE